MSRSRDPHIGKGPTSGPARVESREETSRHSQAREVAMQPSVSNWLSDLMLRERVAGSSKSSTGWSARPWLVERWFRLVVSP